MKEKVVIITGGSSGIGKALAEKFGSMGSKVVITGRNKENLDKAAQELEKKGIDVLPVVADASNLKDAEQMVAATIEKYGKIDVLINNAGISMRALFEDLELDVIKQVMDINFYGTVYATKKALPHILKSKGSIVGISSVAGYRGVPARTGYSASKFAMYGFFESLRTELLKKGVHVLVASPGFTSSNIRKTALTSDGSAQGASPLNEGKIMSAEEVADEVYKAVKNRKRDLVLSFKDKLTVFLNKWVPGFMDKMVYNHMAKEKDSPLKK